ncbi:DUF86 domain-containing protein [Bifidobacterium felsineum]|uniref:HepT-like ribonuclease domain-containing protein n=1 Tax=Bifidobacterium felsineum TaxID=2045440 RepID=UPI001F0A074F|nr:HepT-like ribonuclease domain-containing protein [Bifidobacterium felsineum]
MMVSEHNHSDQSFRDKIILIRLVEHLDHAVEDLQHVNSADELEAHRILFNSVAMEMTQAQECARKLSEECRNAMPDLPWNDLRALRNIIVHDYDEVDPVSLYNTVHQDVPALSAQLRPFTKITD